MALPFVSTVITILATVEALIDNRLLLFITGENLRNTGTADSNFWQADRPGWELFTDRSLVWDISPSTRTLSYKDR